LEPEDPARARVVGEREPILRFRTRNERAANTKVAQASSGHHPVPDGLPGRGLALGAPHRASVSLSASAVSGRSMRTLEPFTRPGPAAPRRALRFAKRARRHARDALEHAVKVGTQCKTR